MTSYKGDSLIVGGGIIGLASAFRLAAANYHVTVFDPDVARGATFAAAGMLAPSGEIAPGEEANYRFQRGAVDAWASLADDLHAVTKSRVAIHRTGTLVVGWDAGDRRLLEQFRHVATTFRVPHTTVTRRDSPRVFEGLSERIAEGAVMTEDGWLDPDEAVAALRAGLDALDVDVIPARVTRIARELGRVVAYTDADRYEGDAGILATGWASLPDGAVPSGEHKVRPVRGVTVRVQGPDRSDQPTVRAFVRGRAFYMVSRPGGYCVLGATSEERVEPPVQLGELSRLLRDALEVVPELDVAAVLETRSGLRPASTDLRPFFERVEPTGWAWSSGHYRHGITLAPIAANDALAFVEGHA